MKRIFSLMLAGILMLSLLTACSDSGKCEHKGGIATCTSPAECSLCGDEYGSENEENHAGKPTWASTADLHYMVYECCGEVISEEAAHNWKVGVCQECHYACEHEGGTATCTSKAVCQKCGALWGENDESSHSVEAQWICDGTTHKKLYTCCNTYEVAQEEHNWQDGVCTVCGYGCLHTGGRADCQTKAVCETCGSEYGEIDSTRHAEIFYWRQSNMAHTKIYPCCDSVNELLTNQEPHTFENGTCLVCGYVCYHSGGEATCVNRAICDNCGTAYGHLDPSNHANLYESDGSANPGVYSCCGLHAVG